MAILRGVVVSFIAFLLLNPLIQSLSSYIEKPLIIFAQDNSESILIGRDSAYYSGQYKDDIGSALDDLSADFELATYTFGSDVVNGPGFDFKDKTTDISDFFETIESKNTHRNVGAVIIASDGIINKGLNPLYSPFHFNAPIYTLALGDTNLQKDYVLNKLNFNRIAYLDNEFPVEVIVNARMLSGDRAKISIQNSEKVIDSKEISIRSNNDFQSVRFRVKASKVGLQRYSIAIDPSPGEISFLNNRQDIFIDILENKQKVLLLYNAPHPDVSAIKQSMESNVNYEFEPFLISDFNKNVSGYNLVILHGLPGMKNPALDILKRIKTDGIPVLYILTNQTNLKALNELSAGITVGQNNLLYNEAQADYNPDFGLFRLDQSTLSIIKSLPPLISPYGNIQQGNAAITLFTQKINGISTDTPLWQFMQGMDTKAGVILGEGLWKWRLKNFALNSNHIAFDELINKTVQYLSIKVDKSQFRLFHKNNFTENENIEFEAEVYDEIYEMIENAEVSIQIVNNKDEQFPFSFTQNQGKYFLNAGKLPEGFYTYEARAKGGQKLFSKAGEFTISSVKIESTNTLADHHLLFNLANKYGGEMIYPSQIKELPQIIASRDDIKPVIYTQKKFTELLNLPWLLGLIILFLSLEWFARKRLGGY
ncbi:MAG: hypothetical protein K9H49_02530 [Bacteroidales bacterium]|nr:hypothetical protein [Bacteroidales bacterium]MCF8403446.1 hypothetical protein [Bacteroidales bacterium]